MFVKTKIQWVIIKLHEAVFIYKIASRKHFISNKHLTITDLLKPSFATILKPAQ